MNLYAWIIIVLAIELAFVLWRKSKRGKITLLLSQALHEKKYEEYDSILEKNKRIFPRFNYEFLIMQKNIMQNNTTGVISNLQNIQKYALSEKQKEASYYDAFNYFMGCEDYCAAEKVMNAVDQCKDEELKFIVKSSYDAIALKGNMYKEDLLNRISKKEYDPQKGYYELILSYIFLNQGNQHEAAMYKELSEQDMLDTEGIMKGTKKESSSS